MKAGFATARGGDSGCQTLTLTSTLTHRGRGPSWRWSRSGSSRLRVLGGGGGCDSEEECEIIYDDDEGVCMICAVHSPIHACIHSFIQKWRRVYCH